jgi:hypothetical protein
MTPNSEKPREKWDILRGGEHPNQDQIYLAMDKEQNDSGAYENIIKLVEKQDLIYLFRVLFTPKEVITEFLKDEDVDWYVQVGKREFAYNDKTGKLTKDPVIRLHEKRSPEIKDGKPYNEHRIEVLDPDNPAYGYYQKGNLNSFTLWVAHIKAEKYGKDPDHKRAKKLAFQQLSEQRKIKEFVRSRFNHTQTVQEAQGQKWTDNRARYYKDYYYIKRNAKEILLMPNLTSPEKDVISELMGEIKDWNDQISIEDYIKAYIKQKSYLRTIYTYQKTRSYMTQIIKKHQTTAIQ